MIDRYMEEANNQFLSGDEKINSMDPNSEDFQELSFHFNTIFNDIHQRSSNNNQNDSKIPGIEKAWSLKNQYISLNFEKREVNEITSYGWYLSNINDDKKIVEFIDKSRFKGQDKIGFDINVSPPPSTEGMQYIIICKFIIGECYIKLQGDEIEQSKEELAENYDSIVTITDNKTRKYEVLKPENIQLLYLVKKKEFNYEPKIIQCNAPNCKTNESGGDNSQNQDTKICYCLLSETYLCKACHIEYHQSQIFFGEFGTENCEKKHSITNYQGDCENTYEHRIIENKKENKKEYKKETIEYFCRDCNRGICSYCRFNGNEKHPNLQLITNLFLSSSLEKNNSFREIRDSYKIKIQTLSKNVSNIQTLNKKAADHLRN
jgi:hypothetical protein